MLNASGLMPVLSDSGRRVRRSEIEGHTERDCARVFNPTGHRLAWSRRSKPPAMQGLLDGCHQTLQRKSTPATLSFERLAFSGSSLVSGEARASRFMMA